MDWKQKIMSDLRLQARRNVEEAVKEIIYVIEKRLDQGVGSKGRFSGYSRSHSRRRVYEGLQDRDKDLYFSGTMRSSIQDTKWKETPMSVEVTVGFTGQAHRRNDQKDSPTNKDIAVWFEKREKQKVLSLAPQEKSVIEEKYKVKIHD